MTTRASSPARPVWLQGPAGRLEALWRPARPARAAALVSHPHPLHGGTLHNPVVFHAERELNRAGLATLRFNFRGVGRSGGTHDGGWGELDDLACAAAWLRGAAPGLPLLLVGYSFGAWCALRLAHRDPGIAAVVACGLPVRHYALAEIETLARPLAVIQADADDLGPLSEVRALLDRAAPPGRLYVVAGTGHLFAGRAADAAAAVVRAVEAILADPRLAPYT
jgi:hypothetical protein